MGKRFLILIGAAALGAALITVGASANFRSVHDPRGDTRCSRYGPSALLGLGQAQRRHRQGDGGPRGQAAEAHDPRRRQVQRAPPLDQHRFGPRHRVRFGYQARSGAPRDPGVRGDRPRTGRARYDFHHHSVEIFFSERSIGNPRSYGWSVYTFVGSRAGIAQDYVPNDPRRYIRHRLRAPAPDRVKYDTELTIRASHGAFLLGGHNVRVQEMRGRATGGRVQVAARWGGSQGRRFYGPQRPLGGADVPREASARSASLVCHGEAQGGRSVRVPRRPLGDLRPESMCRADRRAHLRTAGPNEVAIHAPRSLGAGRSRPRPAQPGGLGSPTRALPPRP